VLVPNDVFRSRTDGWGKKQRDEWQKSNNECEKLDYGIDRGGLKNIGLPFAWRQQQQRNVREVTKTVKDRYNVI